MQNCSVMADAQDSPIDRAEITARRDKDALLDILDTRLEQYLQTLHEYHDVMQHLSAGLSSGYMSLAQANFYNSSSAIRYGQDCYDERMQTVRKVHISEHGCTKENYRAHFSIKSSSTTRQDASTDDQIGSTEQANEAQGPDLPSTGSKSREGEAGATSDADDETAQGSRENEEETRSIGKPTDPLRWFGILVPPALRTAQSTFIGAVEGPIPQLATVVRDLRAQEIEIGRVRKQIKKM
ncbi:hypothetical protein BKA58DRAFT_375163 [Alternaria rosae]|uniref:uncharacterized protein n=1 Tax=Alternaria rosae TaxID=1187941 RepID=UPI001E8CA919|nr:uncharacterized protein BKA58DRAFT_375163 [Alternaria rosae]KAH6877475.1 hypothetical protein BKA58DRAFT_375163 [Alternaria rosae]